MTKTIEKLFTGVVLEAYRVVNNFGGELFNRMNIDPKGNDAGRNGE